MPSPKRVIDRRDHPITHILNRAKKQARLVDRFQAFTELASALVPGTPDSGFGRVYMKDDGKLYFKNDAGTEVELSDTSGRVTLGSSANSISQSEPDGDADNSPFDADVLGSPSSTSVVYDGDTGEDSVFRGLVLHNSTKSEKVKITAINRGTDTITVEANSPDDAGTWEDNDVLTTASVTNTGRAGVFFDIDVTDFVGATDTGILLQASAKRLTAAGGFLILHPYVTYEESKELVNIEALTSWFYNQGWLPVAGDNSRLYITACVLSVGSADLRLNLRFAGTLSA